MPLYDVTCTSCQREWERSAVIANRNAPSECCNAPITIYNRPATGYHPFIPYFDYALGADITSIAQRRRVMKSINVDFRDHPSKGEESARRDKRNDLAKRRARQSLAHK